MTEKCWLMSTFLLSKTYKKSDHKECIEICVNGESHEHFITTVGWLQQFFLGGRGGGGGQLTQSLHMSERTNITLCNC